MERCAGEIDDWGGSIYGWMSRTCMSNHMACSTEGRAPACVESVSRGSTLENTSLGGIPHPTYFLPTYWWTTCAVLSVCLSVRPSPSLRIGRTCLSLP